MNKEHGEDEGEEDDDDDKNARIVDTHTPTHPQRATTLCEITLSKLSVIAALSSWRRIRAKRRLAAEHNGLWARFAAGLVAILIRGVSFMHGLI